MSGPTVPTIKKLFALSSNKCAFPGCKATLVDESSGKVTGKICHIKARSENGPRYDSNQTEDDRHDFENLILMCPIHHDIIDADVRSYTVERLKEIKMNHENSMSYGNSLNDSVANQFIINSQSNDSVTIIAENLGQTVYSITNNFDHQQNVNIKAYCRMLKQNIERLIEICAFQAKQDFAYYLDELPLRDWEQYFFAVSDYLDELEAKQLIEFYDTINELEDYKAKAKIASKKMGLKPDLWYCHAGAHKIYKGCHGYLNKIVKIDLTKVLEKLSSLSK